MRYIPLVTIVLFLSPVVASGQQFGSGPEIREPVRVQRGGYNPLTGRSTGYQSTFDPETGRMERRTVISHPLSQRVTQREQVFDPQTGDTVTRTVQRDAWTGFRVEASRTRNSYTGEGQQTIRMVNPTNGQINGFVRRTLVDPQTGIIRRDIGQYNSFHGAPPAGGFSGSTAYINPYSGQVLTSPRIGVWPR